MATITYRLNSAAPCTFAATAINGAQTFTIASEADVVKANSDGNPYVNGIYVDNISYTGTLETVECPKTLNIGDTGVLVLKAVKRADGEGNTATVLTYTSSATCVITDITTTVNHAGMASSTITFVLGSIDGTTAIMTIA